MRELVSSRGGWSMMTVMMTMMISGEVQSTAHQFLFQSIQLKTKLNGKSRLLWQGNNQSNDEPTKSLTFKFLIPILSENALQDGVPWQKSCQTNAANTKDNKYDVASNEAA